MLTLSKPLQQNEKINKVKDQLVGEVKCMGHYRLSQDLTEGVCNAVEMFVKKKYKINKKDLVLEIFKSAHDLSNEELQVVETQIDYIVQKGLLIKHPKTRRVAKRFLWVLGLSVGMLSMARSS